MKDVRDSHTFTTTDAAELDTQMSEDDISTLRDCIMAIEHTNGS